MLNRMCDAAVDGLHFDLMFLIRQFTYYHERAFASDQGVVVEVRPHGIQAANQNKVRLAKLDKLALGVISLRYAR